jgi:hypothetical protein
MKTRNLDESQFLQDVSKHEMRVIHCDGIHRHIRFQKPGTMCMHFDLITWPGYLCYTGDMGTYVFTRLLDMFEFFRTDADSKYLKSKGLTLGINPSYWGEKVQAQDKYDGLKKFSSDKFAEQIKRITFEWIRENAHRTTKEERREFWEAIEGELLSGDGDRDGAVVMNRAYEFGHKLNDKVSFCFPDLWEYNFTEYSERFMWCCYALAWGIQKFDAETKVAEAVAA